MNTVITLPKISDILTTVSKQAKLIDSGASVSVPIRLKNNFASAWGKPAKVKTDLIELTTSTVGEGNLAIDLVDSKLVKCAFAVSLYEVYARYLEQAELVRNLLPLTNEEWKLLGESADLPPDLVTRITAAIATLPDLDASSKTALGRFMTSPKHQRVADLGSYKGLSRPDAFQPAAANVLSLRVDHYGYINDVIQVLQKHKDITQELVALASEIELGMGTEDQTGEALIESFSGHMQTAGVCCADFEIRKFIASLAAKPFLVLTGLAGSGKTKLAQAFVRWLTPDSSLFGDLGSVDSNPQYALIPVGADWTGNENILGYPDGLDSSRYVSKPALEVILHAHNHPELPHFLILDEMNLSHVERYFADMLSAIESGEPIPLYEGADRFKDGTTKIPQRVSVPRNLFIIGTVNVDETTYMFSPKVLDRANVIEFRMDSRELGSFLKNPTKPDFGKLDGAGVAFARTFVNRAKSSVTVPTEIATRFEEEMLLLFKVLQSSGAEFGYRVAQEASRFLYFYKEFGGFSADNTEWFDDALDAVIVQKLLPKLHGSRGKLEGLLWALATFCGGERTGTTEAFLTECLAAAKCEDEAKFSPEAVDQKLRAANPERKARYASSFDKILRMYRKLVRDQFVTFAEA